jgi:pimeloyl-ACP methyl ester carboxylesterase
MEADGYGFVAFDYRGFGGSPGEISQTHILEDGLAAYDFAAAKGFPIVIWGRSLGSGPSTYVAGERKTDALFLETPFDSATAVGYDRYPYLPVGLLIDDAYPVDQWIGKVTAPVFVAHGTGDKKIAAYHGQRVYDLVANKGGIWIEPGADHDNLWARGEWDKAMQFFTAAEAAAGALASDHACVATVSASSAISRSDVCRASGSICSWVTSESDTEQTVSARAPWRAAMVKSAAVSISTPSTPWAASTS